MVHSTIGRFRLLSALGSALLFAAASYGGAGKLTGKITEKGTGKPIDGANIVEAKNHEWGASSLDGIYTILPIPPGIYDVKVTCLSFHDQEIASVIIQSDLTTVLNVELTPSTIALEAVKIVYVKPPLDIGKSTSGTIFGAEKLKNVKAESIDNILGITKGFKQDMEGRWHVRGSREGAVAIIVEGQDIRDPLVATATNISVSNEAVEEVNVLTGGFNAEYGNAGAIVQITTSEGSKTDYTGRAEIQTDRIIDTYSFDTDRMELSVGGPVPKTRELLGRRVTFYLTSIGALTNTYTPFAITRPSNDYLGIGVPLPERQDNSYQTSLKLATNLTETRKLALFLNESYRRWDIYPTGEGGIDGNYGYGYRYNLEHRPWAQNRQFSGSLTFSNQLSSKSFYSLKVTTFRTHSMVRPRGKSPGDFTMLDDIENDIAGWSFMDYDDTGLPLGPKIYRGSADSKGNSFTDGFWDANGDFVFEGGGEGYEDWNMNGRWDRGEDWVDLNSNGIYDSFEPWIDVVNPLTGENHIGVFDLWDSYSDLNHNGRWDAAEPQLSEQDWNHNGVWDGERFQDADGDGNYDGWEPWQDIDGNYLWDPGEPFTDVNGNGTFDYGEGYDDMNLNGRMDKRDLQPRTDYPDRSEPFIDGDFLWVVEDPFIDEPDVITGLYNGKRDGGEMEAPISVPPDYEPYIALFLRPANADELQRDPSRPIVCTIEGLDASDLPLDPLLFIPGKSTWVNRTIDDVANPKFDAPNGDYDQGKEWLGDYNGNGTWDSSDRYLNPELWDPNAYWQDRTSTEYAVKFDIQSQVSKFHEMKSGVEMKSRNLRMQSIAQPDLPYTGEAALPAGSPWPDRGGIRDFYKYRPYEGAVYAQDKMEFEGLIVNAGIRLDFIIHDQKAVDEFRDRLLRDEPGAILAQRGTYRLSPRLGISHPITEKSKLYFNYGHFYQAPSFQYFYKSATANFDANSTIGNPNLEYEKTIQYELGVNTQISEFVVIDISGYYKDQYDLISTSDERWKNLTLDRYVNLDYGRMRGFELSIEKRPAHHYALTFNYDFSYAYGKASDQHANQQARLKNVPYNYDEHPLGWDETHKINAYLTVNYEKNDHPRLLGLVLPDDWMMTGQWEFGSGLPYSPSKYTTGIENANLILPNSARLPWRERTTLKFEKYYTFNVKKGTKFLFGFTVNNLFNKRNVQSVYGETGSPTKAVHPLNPLYNPNDNRKNFDANPRNFEPGRQVLFRVGMTF